MARQPRWLRRLGKRFSFWWDRMASQGKCDARGGAEYRRVREEWVAADRPWHVKEFIFRRANIDADGNESPGVDQVGDLVDGSELKPEANGDG